MGFLSYFFSNEDDEEVTPEAEGQEEELDLEGLEDLLKI